MLSHIELHALTHVTGEPVRLPGQRDRAAAGSPTGRTGAGSCVRELPELAKLAALARAGASAELVLVSDRGVPVTDAWLAGIVERHPEVAGLRMLVGPAMPRNVDTSVLNSSAARERAGR